MNTYASSFENLSGQLFNTIRIVQILRRHPSVAWSARCERCGTGFVVNHDRARLGECPRGIACGRSVPPPSPTLGSTITVSTGVRASDSASARAYQQQQATPEVTMRPITPAMLRSADPDTLARFIDHQRGRRK